MPELRFASLSLLLASLLLAGSSALADEVMLPLDLESESGRVLLEIQAFDEPLIYTNTLATGLGTPSPLLDRGDTGDSALVVFERHGDKVLLIRDNPAYRAISDNPALVESVRESFPRSVLAAMPVQEERDGGVVVDATDFVLSDVYDVAARLEAADLGRVSLDSDRSYVRADRSGAFPDNTEIRVALTLAVDEPDRRLRRQAADPRSLAFEQQHSFVALPDDGYRPREYHPRSGAFPHVFFNFARSLEEGYEQRWIWRWRLEPSDPEAYLAGELVDPVEPIIFYLDPAIQEPYRSAFREGGNWWAEAFEAAGFSNAFEVRDLPEDADPMDIRYNMLVWVHRNERGPSVGPNYRDPRTGEIISAKTRMDSFRSLVNHDLWMGFLPAAGPDGLAVSSEEMAMARRRQHTAHEIGHSLGMAHNFIAATRDRASVMDYPVPLVRLDDDGHVDLSDAYAEGIGEFDKLAIRYAYTWFPDDESERQGLAEILAEMAEHDQPFITGGHAADDGSYPGATRWVEGNDMFSAYERTRAVRQVLLEHFDDRALGDDEPYVVLQRRFAHVYMHHRTALIGVIKHVGGYAFSYALKRDGLDPTRPVPADDQYRALDEAVAALEPSELRIRDRIADLMAPAPMGWDGGWQWYVDPGAIESPGDTLFDPVDVAHRWSFEIVTRLLEPARMTRSASQHARNDDVPAPGEVMDRLIAATWERDAGAAADGHDAALIRVAQRSVLDGLLDLAGNARAVFSVRAAAEARLHELAESLEPRRRERLSDEEAAHRRLARADIERYFEGRDDPASRPRPEPIALPWP
ncbi:zinc-dependent metalloprotease [Wenzhouxiangella sp. AB-CW3]|uniref:zinc-dependent metalloprotease n=1 Tax=Wenzhouxiangella sp. AB-CW3 TaxID=2771012 RepID=UPI00168B3DDB|nr:zinc-dependent metalloprotease [Wenzhouxiangella sp. AB-CW3]QOC23298.1 zinc-dependent metalloprotease [Wenzhouxiangella sp. AB-CW3]